MKIPTWRHPYPGVQRRIQAYDPNLWLIWLPKRQRWAVVYETRGNPLPTDYHLRGLEGCCGPMCNYNMVTVLWDAKGNYLDPRNIGEQLVAVIAKNDSEKSGDVAERCRRMDEHNERVMAEKTEAARAERRRNLDKLDETVGSGKVVLGIGEKDSVAIDYDRDVKERPMRATRG